jgi:uncharacterized membrane protein
LRLRVAIGALALAGAGIASYLTVAKLTNSATVCPTSGCETVQRSRYSELAGIPVALFGLVAYAAIFGSALRRELLAVAAGAAVALAGFAYAGYLLVVQLAVIDAVCTWCVASDVVVSVLAVLAVARLAHARP